MDKSDSTQPDAFSTKYGAIMDNKHFNDLFQVVPVLETERLVLRPFRHSDIDEYLAFFTTDAVQKYLGGILIPKDMDDAKRWIDNINGRCLKARLVFTWCIQMKADNAIVGRCDLGGFLKKSMAEVSYYLTSDRWHQGIMREALQAVLLFGFGSLKLRRIQALVLPDNKASIALLQRLGFTTEGLLRQYDYGKGFSDVLMHSILANEYSFGHCEHPNEM